VSQETTFVPQQWRLIAAIARAVVAAACGLLLFHRDGFTLGLLPWALYLIFALAVPFLRPLDRALHALLTFFIDLTFFLIWIQQAGDALYAMSGVFLAFLLLTATVFHTWRETGMVAIAALVFSVLVPSLARTHFWTIALPAGILGVLLAMYKGFLHKRLTTLARQSVLFRSEAEKARESERQRIAADFHDGPLQHFISFQMRLEIVRKLLERDVAAAVRELHQLQDLCRSQVTEMRAFLRSMRPPEQEGAGLVTCIRRMLEAFQKDTGVVATFNRGESLGADDPEVAPELLQVIREALNNVHKHARASRVAISVDRVDAGYEISVEDDGAGFPFSGSYTLDELELLRLGPLSIKRRVRSLGGDMVLESRPGHGAGMQIRIPA
jgi:signal transduction histidine kinase